MLRVSVVPISIYLVLFQIITARKKRYTNAPRLKSPRCVWSACVFVRFVRLLYLKNTTMTKREKFPSMTCENL